MLASEAVCLGRDGLHLLVRHNKLNYALLSYKSIPVIVAGGHVLDIFSQEANPAACWEPPVPRLFQDVFVTFGGVVCKLKAANPIKQPPPPPPTKKKTGQKKRKLTQMQTCTLVLTFVCITRI